MKLYDRLFILIGLYQSCVGISVTRVVAPHVVEAGGEAVLRCEWHLESEKLYSVKWYQGSREIYRYTPSKAQAVQVFSNDYLQVDPHKSEEGVIKIYNVSLGAEGMFRCEVSGDAPAFYTAYGRAKVTVVVLPSEEPIIFGVLPYYQMNDFVDVTCQSPVAKPAPNLTFYVNDEKPLPVSVGPQTIKKGRGGLERSALRLRFGLRSEIITRGVEIKCVAEIKGLYLQYKSIILHTPFVPMMGSQTSAAEKITEMSCFYLVVTSLLSSLL